MKKLIAAALVGAGFLIGTPVASADVTVCSYLDAVPTVAGVEDVIAILLVRNGLTPEEAGQVLYSEITNYCPRHLLTLQAAMDAYGVGHTQRV